MRFHTARRTFVGLSLASLAWPAVAQTPKPANVLTPDAALNELMQGNQRYVKGLTRRHDFRSERAALALGQNPYVGILSCADSRVGPEFAFDSARGDLFVVRIAGNFANDDNVASLEYGVAVLNTPLVMVLGHSSCGAIVSTIKSIDSKTTLPGHLPVACFRAHDGGDGGQGAARRSRYQCNQNECEDDRGPAEGRDTDPQQGRRGQEIHGGRRLLRSGHGDRYARYLNKRAGLMARTRPANLGENKPVRVNSWAPTSVCSGFDERALGLVWDAIERCLEHDASVSTFRGLPSARICRNARAPRILQNQPNAGAIYGLNRKAVSSFRAEPKLPSW